ncbi:hypothetical protein EON62_01975 [archaeon]|nr:MAG: hypothetical protein EON62_01975 [archaeon]
MAIMSDSTAVGVELYVLILGVFFISVPGFVMAVRLLLRSRHEGLMAMFTPPLELDKSKRRLSVRVSRWLYQRTSYGYLLDVAQAVLSAISCVLFIVVSYMATEPVSVRDVEDAFTVYFAIDYSLRLWMARDSLSWYFSLVSLLDFVTVFPALTTWLMQAGGEYDTNVAIIMEVRCLPYAHACAHTLAPGVVRARVCVCVCARARARLHGGDRPHPSSHA